jgi:hypothetical protein
MQVAQDQVQHVPASHKQLLELFGVSPQVAVWVAAIMAHSGPELPTPGACWWWNPHGLAANLSSVLRFGSTEGIDPGGMLQEQAVEALQPQLQHWSDRPVLELLMPVLLYGAAHATADDGSGVWAQQCQDTADA